MNNIARLLMVVVIIFVASSHTAQAHWFSNSYHVKNSKRAKVTIIEAIQKASEAQDGIVIGAELDDEGDDRLIYEIDIIKDGEEYEMNVDAITGEVSIDNDSWFN